VNVSSIALVTHGGKPAAVKAEKEITALLHERGIATDGDVPDLVISLGGDGTMLRAARVALDADAPLLGINVGTLGYLTEVNPGEERAAISKALDGEFDIEERMMLACRAEGHELDSRFVALNEALVERSSRHLVRLSVKIDEELLTVFNGDGVLVATPTGSTAYALSAGGPIVSPSAECMVLVPVNAHMILTRPFVLAPGQYVELTVEGEREAVLSLDGEEGPRLPPGSVATVRVHPSSLKLVKLEGPGFVERLRIKLDLPGG
jgi:NAD+ kinase